MGVATTVEKRPAPRCSIEGMRSKASANGGAATRMEQLKPLQITVVVPGVVNRVPAACNGTSPSRVRRSRRNLKLLREVVQPVA